MPRWDDPRGPRHDPERDRWRRSSIRDRGGPGGERRGFDEPDRRYDDAGAAGYQNRLRDRQRSETYGAPDYGSELNYDPESEGGFGRSETGQGPGWGLDRDAERRRNFDLDDPGVGQSQAGYGQRAEPRPQPHPDHDFDPDYLRWRDAQLRSHDRDYQDWRREQQRQYDDEYRRFRSERQRHFGQAFHEWRFQRSTVGGGPDTSLASGVSGYGGRTAMPGGYDAPGAYPRPSGALDPPGHLSTDPAMSQRGGDAPSQGAAPTAGGGDRSPEFGNEPGQVQATSEGRVQGHDKDEDGRRH